MIGLWRAYQKFDENKGSFSAYAYTTVRGTILSYLKGNALREARETPAEYDLLALNEDPAPIVPLEADTINQYIEHLTPREKIYVIEYLLEGYSYKEIAYKYHVSTGAVKNWGKTARKN